jgi:hypothetical protein
MEAVHSETASKNQVFWKAVFQGKILNLRNFMHGKSPSGKLDFLKHLPSVNTPTYIPQKNPWLEEIPFLYSL